MNRLVKYYFVNLCIGFSTDSHSNESPANIIKEPESIILPKSDSQEKNDGEESKNTSDVIETVREGSQEDYSQKKNESLVTFKIKYEINGVEKEIIQLSTAKEVQKIPSGAKNIDIKFVGPTPLGDIWEKLRGMNIHMVRTLDFSAVPMKNPYFLKGMSIRADYLVLSTSELDMNNNELQDIVDPILPFLFKIKKGIFVSKATESMLGVFNFKKFFQLAEISVKKENDNDKYLILKLTSPKKQTVNMIFIKNSGFSTKLINQIEKPVAPARITTQIIPLPQEKIIESNDLFETLLGAGRKNKVPERSKMFIARAHKMLQCSIVPKDVKTQVKTLLPQYEKAITAKDPSNDDYSTMRIFERIISMPWMPEELGSLPVLIDKKTGEKVTYKEKTKYAETVVKKLKEDLGILHMDNVVREIVYGVIDSCSDDNNFNGILLCGPPGVGKTAILEAICKVLGLPIKVIVMTSKNVSDLVGVAPQFVGARPGDIMAFFYSERHWDPDNPGDAWWMRGICIDEAEKAKKEGSSGKDVAEVFLPVTDTSGQGLEDENLKIRLPKSNTPYKTILVFTANDINSLSAPLKDRLKLIEVSGYSKEQKIEILCHRLEENNQYKNYKDRIQFPRKTIEFLEHQYSKNNPGLRESIQNMQKTIQYAVKEAEENPDRIVVVDEEFVRCHVGLPLIEYKLEWKLPEGTTQCCAMLRGMTRNNEGVSPEIVRIVVTAQDPRSARGGGPNVIASNESANFHNITAAKQIATLVYNQTSLSYGENIERMNVEVITNGFLEGEEINLVAFYIFLGMISLSLKESIANGVLPIAGLRSDGSLMPVDQLNSRIKKIINSIDMSSNPERLKLIIFGTHPENQKALENITGPEVDVVIINDIRLLLELLFKKIGGYDDTKDKY